MQNKLYTI